MSEKNFAAASLAAQAMGWIDPVTKAVVPPIHMASTYQRDEDNGYRSGRIYARADNPTFDQAEATLANGRAEAAVIAVASEKWGERPLAAVVLKPGASADPDELRAFLAPRFPKFWLPDAIAYVEAIPRTSTGKFQKSELRRRFGGL
jgi:acyl-CoA synthetase (AMP-forming)/AMP-acid ligase II